MSTYVDYYCKDNCKKLISLVNKIISNKFPWVLQKDYDDFYSIAGQVLWDCEKNFDESKETKFETFFINCLIRKFKTQLTYMNRKKRSLKDAEGNEIVTVSLDALIDDNNVSLLNMVATDCFDEDCDTYSDKMNTYLSRLSSLQKKVLFLLADGYTPEEIKITVNITAKEFMDIYTSIRAYRNVSVLY